MIEEISIRDLGVIEHTVLPLGPGFTAITGETGAGKTMVVHALGLLRGDRADSGVVRLGAERSVVEGRWVVPSDGAVAERVADLDADLDTVDAGSAELIIARTIAAEGRSRASVGGRSAPAAVLAELGEHLVAVHGQSDQIRLTTERAQREILDRFGGQSLALAKDAFAATFREFLDTSRAYRALVDERDARSREAEDLRSTLERIERVAPAPREDEELDEQIARLTNIESLRNNAAHAYRLITDDDGDGVGASQLVDEAQRDIERLVIDDPSVVPLRDAFAGVAIQLADAGTELARYLDDLDGSAPSELGRLHERRAELTDLLRLHGPTLDDVERINRAGGVRLLELDGDDDRIDELEREQAALGTVVKQHAERLSAERKRAGEALQSAVSAELAALAMPNASLIVEFRDREELTADGAEQVEILLQPHPGSPPRPVAKGASGGELSRIMLAIEVVVAGVDPVPTFVFDEVDAGVGGAAAIEIGRRLARLAESAQVIVVTHLAQVAAFATNHLSIEKSTDGAVTTSSVTPLSGEARIAELTRLLSGLAGSQSGSDHARELLELAQADSIPAALGSAGARDGS